MTGEITMDTWNALATPPDWAVTPIKGGVLGKLGYHDIDPIWRLEKLTELFGPCGEGWQWTVVACGLGPDFFWIHGRLRVKDVSGGWGEPIDGMGANDLRQGKEAVKGAETAALAAACKKLGMGASVYKGKFDGSTYAGASLLSASEGEHLMGGKRATEDEPPPVDDVPPVCKCGQPMKHLMSKPGVAKPWSAWVCSIRKNKQDPNGCDTWNWIQ